MTFKEFILAMINPNDNRVSSKTVLGICSWVIVAIACLFNLFLDFRMTDFMFFGILGFATAVFGLNTVITTSKISAIKAPDTNVNVEGDGRVQVNNPATKPQPVMTVTNDSVTTNVPKIETEEFDEDGLPKQ